MPKSKPSKKVPLQPTTQVRWAIGIALLAFVCSILYFHYHDHYIDNYEDVHGAVFECGKPVKAKKLAEPRGIVGGYLYEPANPAEAAKYCTSTGVE